MRLQYALDFLTADEALRMAGIAVESGVTCLEAGHVLIKACGVRILSDLRRRFGDIELVADMKTMDMGAEEVLLAAQAGADQVIVCAAASDGVIEAALGQAEKSEVGLLVSLMGVRRRVTRTTELMRLGVTKVIAHRGIDDTYTWSDPQARSDLYDLLDLGDVAVALAGGISAATVRGFTGLNLERVIVGRGITCADDPAAAARALVAAVADRPCRQPQHTARRS